MTTQEMAAFVAKWKHEAQNTAKVLRALPQDKYDFRPDPQGRSLGEMAWHLSEIDALIADAVANGAFDFSAKLPGLERPRVISELAPGYERVHASALAKIQYLKPAELERKIPSPLGGDFTVEQVLDGWLLHHAIHHRGQLVMMLRLAGGTPPGLYGPTREEMAAMKANA
jgi:uncharacterized damage-inducible protein DinB